MIIKFHRLERTASPLKRTGCSVQAEYAIRTDEVIITDNQIQHIKDRHPDYIVETPKPNTALILKEIITEKEKIKTVLRLATSVDNKEYKNSIITFMKIDEKEWNRLLRNKRVFYKKE